MSSEYLITFLELYLRMTVTKSFSTEYGDESSIQYATFKSSIEEKVLGAVKHMEAETVDVQRLHKPDMILLCIRFEESPDRAYVRNALEHVTIPCAVQGEFYKVVSGSIIIDEDNITSDIKLQILRGRHIRDHKMDFEIDLDSQYEELRVIRQAPGRSGEDISDENIIEGDARNQKILILGRAGVGKSTLMQRLARKWANGVWAVHFKAIFFLNLRYLISDKKEMNFASVVSLIPTYIDVENMIKIDDKWLKKNEGDIAFMLDGLDEIGKVKKWWNKLGDGDGNHTSLDWCFQLLKRKYLPKSTLLISSRSSEHVHSLLKPTDTVEVMGLSSTKIPSFIKKNVKEEQRDKVKESLIGNQILVSISSITFYCAALCRLLQTDNTPAGKLNTYTRITAYLLEMYICRSLKDGSTRDDVYDDMETSLRAMSQLAYNGLRESQPVPSFKECYSEDDLKAAGISDEIMRELCSAGLLLRTEVPNTENPQMNITWAQFVHLSIQEYMAMATLLTQSQNERQATLDNLLSASSQFNMALLYLVGLAFQDGDDSALSRTASAIENPSERKRSRTEAMRDTLTNVAVTIADPLLAIQMVYESQSASVATAVGEQQFGDGVKIEDTKMTLIEVNGLMFLLGNCSSITKIMLRNVGLDESSVKEVSSFLSRNESIKEARLFDRTIDGSSIEAFMEAVMQNKHLQRLELSFSQNIGDDGMGCVSDALMENKALKHLRLAGGSLRTGGAQSLLHALQNGNQEVKIKMYDSTCDESTRKDLEPYIQGGRLTFEGELEKQGSPAS